MNIPAAALNKFLGKFFKDVRKQNGGEYEPGSVSSFQKSILELSSSSSFFSVFLIPHWGNEGEKYVKV